MTSTASSAPSAIAIRRSAARASETARSRSAPQRAPGRARPGAGGRPGSSPPSTPRTPGGPAVAVPPVAAGAGGGGEPADPFRVIDDGCGGEFVRGADQRHLVARAAPACPGLGRRARRPSAAPPRRGRAPRTARAASPRAARWCGRRGTASPTATAPARPRPGRPRPPTARTGRRRRGPLRPASRTARPTAGLASCAITRTSARSRRTSSAVSSADRSFSWAQITAIAPARPADISVSSARACPVISGTSQAAIIRGEGRGGVVVDDHGGHAGQRQLLDDRQPDSGQPADDHVPAPVRLRIPHLAEHSRLGLPAC